MSDPFLAATKQSTGLRDRYQDFYNTKEWRALRKMFIRMNRSKGCAYCGKPFGKAEFIEVDHRIPIRENWELRLQPTNLRLMHRWCHNSHTHSKRPAMRLDGLPEDGSWG